MLQRVLTFTFLTTKHYNTLNIPHRRSSVVILFNTKEISLHVAAYTVT